MRAQSPSLVTATLILCAAAAALSCGAGEPPPEPAAEFEVVTSKRPSTWFEDAWSYFEISPGEESALYGARFGFELIDLETESSEPLTARGGDAQVAMAYFTADDLLMQLEVAGHEGAWFVEGMAEPEPVPPFPSMRRSPDGQASAYFDTSERELVLSTTAGLSRASRYAIPGFGAGISWAPGGTHVYALVWKDDGTSAILGVVPGDEILETIADGLDAVWRFGSSAVSNDRQSLYLALAGEGPPDVEARHRPGPIRDLDIYRLDLATGATAPVVDSPGDDFNPQVIGDHLYWTHNDLSDSVVAFPIAGGEPWLVAEDAEIPYWSPDGSQIGLTYGGWRLADWALNLDGGVIEVDENARPISEVTPMVIGYHEDFSPVWSPDGSWIAYHSHRSEQPGSYYSDEGSTDSIYIRRLADPAGTEASLFDFGWEVGNPDWSPDGRRLVFDSWDRDNPGVSWPWIATIDPDTGETLSVERLPLPAGITNVTLSAWSPGGDEIAVVESIEGTRQAIWILPMNGSEAEKLLEIEASTYGGIDWTPDGDRLVFGALAGNRMQIFSVPRSGGAPTRLTDDRANLMHPQVSPDGRWIACTRMDQTKELRRMLLR